MHMRIEFAGLRGLLLLLQWAERQCFSEGNGHWRTIVRRVRPHESGLWARRYCELEMVEVFDRTHRRKTRRGLRWADALSELQVPLRAMYVFHGHRGLQA